MAKQANLGGTFTFPGTSMNVHRMGYGAMQLAGPQVFGPPADVDRAVAVLREAVDSGIDHIDTSDFYGPHVVNEINSWFAPETNDRFIRITDGSGQPLYVSTSPRDCSFDASAVWAEASWPTLTTIVNGPL